MEDTRFYSEDVQLDLRSVRLAKLRIEYPVLFQKCPIDVERCRTWFEKRLI